MKPTTLRTLAVIAACFAAFSGFSVAGAQSVRHDMMDARAARRDIRRLQADRARAVRYHNWGKVAQDDRLIGQDRYWIYKDTARVEHAGIPPR